MIIVSLDNASVWYYVRKGRCSHVSIHFTEEKHQTALSVGVYLAWAGVEMTYVSNNNYLNSALEEMPVGFY